MFLGAIHTKTKRQPVSPGLPWILTYSAACTILVFDEGFMTFRADYMNDMMAVALRNIHHGTPMARILEKYGTEFKTPEDVFGVPNDLLTPQLIRSNPKFAMAPLVPADDIFQAWIASNRIFSSQKGPWAMGIVGRSKEWRVSMLSRTHLIQSVPSEAAALLRRVVPAKNLQIKLPA
jgi:hypothetical protein